MATLLTLISLTAVGLLAGAGVASAHVTVNPSEAAVGGFTKLTFRVPNESPTAGTVAVTVDLPADHPFAFVSVKQVPGWSVVPTTSTLPAPVTEGDLTIKEAVTSVTWTADPGTMIGPGEFAEFDISAGPVPDTETLVFPTTQTYNDGEVVQWNEPTPASGEEPEHPAPTLTVGPADGSEHGATNPSRGQHPGDRARPCRPSRPPHPAVPIPPQRFSRRSVWCSQQRHWWSPQWHCGGGRAGNREG